MSRLPVLFVSHGAPSYALEPGLAGPQLTALGKRLPTPQAVLVVSPHWTTQGVKVGSAGMPHTVHDFGGFAAELHRLHYIAPGHPDLAAAAADLLHHGGWHVQADAHRGLDHGAWVPLLHLYPEATLPVFQVSMPFDLTATTAVRLGRALAPLSERGVLLLGSGSLTHNLRELQIDSTREEAYVREFTSWVRGRVQSGDLPGVASAIADAPHGRRAHPTDEHYLPLLVAMGAAGSSSVEVLDGGIQCGVLAMESYVFHRSTRVQAPPLPATPEASKRARLAQAATPKACS